MKKGLALTMLGLATAMDNTGKASNIEYLSDRIDLPMLSVDTNSSRTYRKTQLSNKQKKSRAASKRARKARRNSR